MNKKIDGKNLVSLMLLNDFLLPHSLFNCNECGNIQEEEQEDVYTKDKNISEENI